MTERHNHDEPVIAPGAAPDHGPNFWADLESAMASEANTTATPHTAETMQMQSVPAAAGVRDDRTAEMPAVGAAASSPVPTPIRSARTARSRRVWPMAAAAAVLALVGLGAFALSGVNEGDTTDVVAGPTTADAAPLDGPQDPNADDTNADDSSADDTGSGDESGAGASTTGNDTSDAETSTAAAADETATAGAAAEPTLTAAPAIVSFDRAPGAIGDPLHLPLDQGIPADGTFLANWSAPGVSWYATTNEGATCASANYSEIRYVNGSGLTQPLRDPQLRFSGDVSHFVVRPEQNVAAWVVSCGSQLELYVATLDLSGQVDEMTLAWLGEGLVSSALVLWEANEVSLNAIEPSGKAFNVDYNLETRLVSRNGGPSRIMLEAGAPAERSLTPLAATPDGGMTYWAGAAPAGTVSACSELFGSGVSDTLWLRQGEGQWQPAVVDDVPLATVTAAAIEPEFTQIAFADVCDDETGRLFVGTQRADGRISNLREIDLSPYVPGFAAQLHWVDNKTLRIETDNSEYGVDPVRFDFRFDDGRENGIIVQLD